MTATGSARQRSSGLSASRPGSLAAGLAALAVAALAPACAQATVFNLTATNIVFENPAPLFTSHTITGSITLDDAILPGQSFSAANVTALFLNFGGLTGNLADVQAEIQPGPVQLFGTRSADGTTFSVFDFRFGFPTTTPGCSFVCAGDIIINSPIGPNDPSNFIALDDLNGDTLSIIDSFDPHFTAVGVGALVPEPGAWLLMIVGFGLTGAALRRRRAVPAMAVDSSR